MEAYPSTMLPGPTIDYALSERSATIRSQMESGRFRQRRRFTTSANVVPVSWIFTPFQFSMFRSWFFFKVSQGADYFTMDLDLGGEEDPQNVAARIVEGVYDARYQDGNWLVTATLEVENPTLVTETTFDDFIALDQPLDSLELAVAQFDNLLNVVLPGNFN